MTTRWITLLMLLVAALAGGGTALALDRALHRGPPPREAPHDPGHRRHPSEGRRPPFDPAARFTRDLHLTTAQQARLDSVLARQREEVQRIREETQPGYDSIAARSRRAIDSLLTPGQRRSLDSARAAWPHDGRSGARPPSSR
jgi:Spy/CpxP family protein refolding chaperone